MPRDDTGHPIVPPVGDPRRSAVPIRDRLRFELEDPPVEDDDCDCRGCRSRQRQIEPRGDQE